MYRHHLVPTRPPEHGEEEIVAVFQQLSKFPLSVEDVGQLLVTDALPGDSLPFRLSIAASRVWSLRRGRDVP
jgi:hypothetical protein